MFIKLLLRAYLEEIDNLSDDEVDDFNGRVGIDDNGDD